MSDDELERRLRDVLRLRKLSVEADPGMLNRVHAGAHRRQRRRAAAGATAGIAAVAAIGVVASTVALGPRGQHRFSADDNHSLSSSPTSVATSQFRGDTSTSATSSPLPSMSSSDASNAPRTFTPASVTAVSAKTFWVLGYTTTTYSDGGSVAPTLYRSDDAGNTFALVSQPDFLLAQEPIPRPSNAPLVTDVRFGDSKNGWAYGDALYQTTDAGKTWLPVKDIPGGVVDLVAANNVAWAVVNSASNPWDRQASSPSDPKYAIYSTPYGDSPQHWSRVALPFDDLGGPQPSIVDQDGTVTLLVAGPLRDGYREHALVAKPGEPFTDHEAPCFQDNGGYLSNSKKAIWAVCPTGHAAELFVSTNRGVTWNAATGPNNFPDPGRGIGAIDDQHVMVSDSATGALLRVGLQGPGTPVDAPVQGSVGASFIGFTNESTGFAIVPNHDATSQLLRTTDGGLHWFEVKIEP
jgi:hypothetical protein